MIQVAAALAAASKSAERVGSNMPPLPPAAGIIQIAMDYRQDTQQVKNILHCQLVGPADAESLETLAGVVEASWRSNLQPVQANTVTLDSITIRDLSSSSGAAIFHATGPLNSGGRGVIAAPNSVTLAMSVRTALNGRSYRGRIYHIGLTNDQLGVNRVLPATAASLVAAYKDFLDVPTAGGFGGAVYGILSYYSGGSLRATPVFTPASTITTDGVLDNQRRRLPGRGA